MYEEKDDVLKQGEHLEIDDNAQVSEDVVEIKSSKMSKEDMIKYGSIGIAVVIVLIICGALYMRYINPNIPSEEVVEEDSDLFSEVDESIVETSFTEDQISELKAYGYSDDDIENLELAYGDYETFKDHVQSNIDRITSEYEKEMYDSTSAEFKELYSKTWLGGTPIKDLKEQETGYDDDSSEILNLDYVKLKASGYQLFVRIKYKEEYLFMSVSPDRWVTLEDKGNIVVEVETMTYDEVPIVISIQEVNINGD